MLGELLKPEIHDIDPRQFTTEHQQPEFLVVLWTAGVQAGSSWRASEYRITHASVVQAIAWATSQSDGASRFTLHLIVPAALDGGTPSLIWLAGQRPS